jgi:8-oxo-dGTP pyrophosphatase MutT (NUDIX family)
MLTATGGERQAAALPVRGGRVCLVSSRGGRHWVIPKGGVGPGRSAGEVALREAWEEAGLTGALDAEPAGSYLHAKADGPRHVTVHVLRVTHEADTWPEAGLRARRWVPAAEALRLLPEEGLRDIVRVVLGKVEPVPSPAAL